MSAFEWLDAQNVVNVAVVVTFAALFAYFLLKWQADVRERPAELIFCVGGRLG